MQKARGQAFVLRRIALPPLVGKRFQVLFHSPHRGSFRLSLTVLVHYRSPGNIVFFLFLEVLRCFSSLGSRRATYGFSDGRLGITPAGFPHSGILGSKPACGSPRLIAASHALRRFLAPRHPPFALSSLTTNNLLA